MPEHVDTVADRNLIVLGLDSSQPLLRQWENYNSIRITSTGVATAPGLNFLQRLIQPFDPRAPSYSGAAVELAKASIGKPYAYMSSFWSPLDANRIVVAIGSNQEAALVELSKQMEDPDLAAKIQGDFRPEEIRRRIATLVESSMACGIFWTCSVRLRDFCHGHIGGNRPAVWRALGEATSCDAEQSGMSR